MKITAKVVKLPEFDKIRLGSENIKRAAMAGGQVIETYAKINVESTFSGKSTGGAGLAGSIQTVITKSTGTDAKVSIGPSVVYGRIHELGGIIKTVHAKFLHFVIDGQDIFAKLVHIPARPYLRPAADNHMDDIQQAVSASIRADLERFA